MVVVFCGDEQVADTQFLLVLEHRGADGGVEAHGAEVRPRDEDGVVGGVGAVQRVDEVREFVGLDGADIAVAFGGEGRDSRERVGRHCKGAAQARGVAQDARTGCLAGDVGEGDAGYLEAVGAEYVGGHGRGFGLAHRGELGSVAH